MRVVTLKSFEESQAVSSGGTGAEGFDILILHTVCDYCYLSSQFFHSCQRLVDIAGTRQPMEAICSVTRAFDFAPDARDPREGDTTCSRNRRQNFLHFDSTNSYFLSSSSGTCSSLVRRASCGAFHRCKSMPISLL